MTDVQYVVQLVPASGASSEFETILVVPLVSVVPVVPKVLCESLMSVLLLVPASMVSFEFSMLATMVPLVSVPQANGMHTSGGV